MGVCVFMVLMWLGFRRWDIQADSVAISPKEMNRLLKLR